MAMSYLDEDEVWKCPAHPSKRRHPYGVCPRCLRDKLSSLCPDCASLRPCSCSSSDSSASSSSSSTSSFSRFFSSRSSSAAPDRSLTGNVANLVDSEPSFRRSRSVATLNLPSFLRSHSKFAGGRDANPAATPPPPAKTGSSFWGMFRSERTDSGGGVEEDRRTMMRKSRSVAVASADRRYGGYNSNCAESGKGRGWSRYFPSPMKMFGGGHNRRSSSRSPLYRGGVKLSSFD